jgi:hypothetical protein
MPRSLPVVHVAGDSISVEYRPWLEKFLEGTWRYSCPGGEAEARLNLDNPVGANTGDSVRLLAYFRALMQRDDFRPDLLMVNCGLHDIRSALVTGAKQVALADYESNLREIVRLAAARGIPMAWVRTTHVCDELHNSRSTDFHRFAKDAEAYDEAACRVMAGAGVPAINLGDFTRKLGPGTEILRDHVHFTEAVQEKQAAFLAGWLEAWRDLRATKA